MTQQDNSSDATMSALFRSELANHIKMLQNWMFELQQAPAKLDLLERMAESARSIKGAAKLLQVQPLAELAGGMEDMLRGAQRAQETLSTPQNEALAQAIEAFKKVLEGDDDNIAESQKWKVEDLQSVLDAHMVVKKASASIPDKLPPTLPRVIGKEKESTPRVIAAQHQPKTDEPASDQQIVSLFFVELETQTGILSDGLLALEANSHDSEAIESLMRAAHSIKGAARVLGLTDLIHLAHALEDAFTSVANHTIQIDSHTIDVMFSGIDVFSTLVKAGPTEFDSTLASRSVAIHEIIDQLEALRGGTEKLANDSPAPERVAIATEPLPTPLTVKADPEPVTGNTLGDLAPGLRLPTQTGSQRRLNEARQATRVSRKDRVVRVTADYLTRLMGLAGELLVESRWLHPFSDALMHLKKSQYELSGIVDVLRATVNEKVLGEEGDQYLLDLQHKTHQCRENLAKHLEDLELFIRRHATLSDRLYRQVITSRMCPFGDGVEAFPRMVRDLAKQLGKKVSLEIIGRSTTIDRDILDKLKAPLNHLLRNAIDHGIEMPDERIAAGKPPEGHIRLEARHRAGVLSITVSDDGRGVDLPEIRNKVKISKLVDSDMAHNLTESELLDFLFLPGFTTSKEITEISGRGVGLNVVQNMVHEVSGQVRVGGKKGQGATFSLQLPLTLSVLRALLVVIGGEPYAFPLARVERAMVLDRSRIQMVENREYYNFNGQNIGLIPGYSILELPEGRKIIPELSIVVLTDGINSYGVVVDRLLGEKELVVQELDPRIGKVGDVACGAFMEDGSPILVIDVEDMVRSVDKLLSTGGLGNLGSAPLEQQNKRRKRVLVVDDSITVREVECRILENHGYEVDVAVNGVDGWNTVRIGDYDLVVTDVDMPRMNGIELVKSIKNDPRLRTLPVMIVSYKERSDDRMLGMEAGANYYLAKSSFHDDRFLEAVRDLIGDPAQEK
ncbi:MAG: response regulator [Chlamydiales bacterium]|nr:response regulator [Chlamydiales bacterium]